MKTSTKILAATTLAATLAAAGAAWAHQGMGMQHGGMNPGGMPGHDQHADAATRLDALKSALKITPAQEGAWAAYGAVVTRQVEARNNLHDKMQAQMHGPDTSAIQDHAAVRDTMQKFQQQMQTERAAALKTLYAALTPEQQALADQQMRGMGGGRMAVHMGGHMGGGMKGGGMMDGRRGGQPHHDHGAGPQHGR